MRHEFTAAASRALKAAARWTLGMGDDSISPPQLLLGLLDEAESRAAQMLAARGVDAAAVRARWSDLPWGDLPRSLDNDDLGRSPHDNDDLGRSPHDEARQLSPAVQQALAAAACHLVDFPRPLELATEHLLLALVASDDELANWLAERGFAAETLAAEICHLYGYQGNDEEEKLDLQSAGEPEKEDAAAVSCPLSVVRGNDEPRTTNHQLFRLLDAAANRAREGLRVVEDFVRFVWDDRCLMRQLKQLRHDLAAALSRLPAESFLAARDTLADVGTTVSTAAEAERSDALGVVTANFKRLQESLRSLEEYGKVVDPLMSAQIEQLRYRSYTLERAAAATGFGLTRLADARLYVLIDGRENLDAFAALARGLVAVGVDVLQLRDKQLADRDLLKRAHLLRELTCDTATLFIMNDRPDLAALARADGVHVGQEELSVAECRAIVGPQALIGVSTHSLEQARQASLDGANYLGVGPIFASRTKSFDAAALQGVELLRAVKAAVSLPIFAIGGIDHTLLPQIISAGCSRVAVSGAVLSAHDPCHAAKDILQTLKSRAVF